MKYIILTLLALVASIQNKAALADYLVVTCNTCVTTSQYEAAAISAHGTRSGWGDYAVANIDRKEFKYVTVQYTRPGDVITGVNDANSNRNNDWHAYFGMVVAPQPSSNGTADITSADIAMAVDGLRGGHTAATWDPPAAERAQFEAMVSLSQDNVLFTAPPNIYGFDSFISGISDVAGKLDATIRAALTANNPAWASGVINPNLFEALLNALGMTEGKGPAGCVIFYNGDVGCFQINLLAPGAVRYIDGTAKDANGDPIIYDGGLPNGAGVGVDVAPNTPVIGSNGWGPPGGGWWIFCAMSEGKPVGCYVQWVAE